MKTSRFYLTVLLALIPMAVVPVAGITGVIGMPDATPNCKLGIPNSGKFIDVSRGLATIGDVAPGDRTFNVSLAVPASLDRFQLSVFDADMGGLWDRLPVGPPDQIRFELYKDPNLEGSTNPADLVGTWETPSSLADNRWCDLSESGVIECRDSPCDSPQTLPRIDQACPSVPSGNCFYHLVAHWNTEEEDNESNFFKVAVEGTPFLLGGSTIGFQASDSNTAALPSDPTSTNTAYDGIFEFQLLVTEEQVVMDLFDGDFDRADDTNDPNSPSSDCHATQQADYVSGAYGDAVQVAAWKNNRDAGLGCAIQQFDSETQAWVTVPFPPFQQSANTLAQGANLGDPRDDPIPGLGGPIAFVVPPNVKYSISAPPQDPADSNSPPLWTVVNDNPSGNKEWELFRIANQGATLPDGVTPDVTVPTIPAGLYTWKIEGADAANNLFIHSKYNLFPSSDGLCDLTVTKTCEVVQPPTPFICSSAKPIDSLTMIWNGVESVRIVAWKGVEGSTRLADIDNIALGQKVTVSGFAGSPNDVIWQVFQAGTSTPYGTGRSTFHLSCSDPDMNGPEDCGKPAGDGKALSGYVNEWLFDGMIGIDAGSAQVLACSPVGGSASNDCTVAGHEASCATLGKPTSLTFRYTGGGCATSNNTQAPDKATCSGALDATLPATVTTTNAGYSILPNPVPPGQTVTVSASQFSADSFFSLTNSGSEALKIHTSCSQPLQVGDVFGSLTLVGFNGDSGGAEVLYEYVVSGGGTETKGLVLYDSVLGQIAGPIVLPAGETRTFQETATITATTSNIATVTGFQDTTQCIASASATVTVEGPPPPECKALGASTLAIDDGKIEWKVTNQGQETITIGSIEITWPAAKGDLKKVKRERDEIFNGDKQGGNLSPPTATISAFINTLYKRQIEPGKERKLIFEFTGKYKGTAADYGITVNFAEGCSAGL
jgi:hypothetical protein